MKTRLFIFLCLVSFVSLWSATSQIAISAQQPEHTLTVSVLVNNYTLIDVQRDESNTPIKYVYCFEASAICDDPEVRAEMVPPNHTWTLTPSGKEKNTDGYSPNWGFIVSFSEPGFKSVTATATINFSHTVGNDTHNYSGTGTAVCEFTILDNVTPQPCPDICKEDEDCDECSGDSCPAPTTAQTNSALGGLGVMAFAAGANTRVQNFSHNSGQAEATLDLFVNETKPNITGYDKNYRYDNMFGNGVRFFVPVATSTQPKIINVALNQKPKTPQLITVELMQYGPLLFKEPKKLVFDAKDAKPDVSYRFSIPVDVSSLNSGSYKWQVQITRHYSDGTTDQSIAVGRQEIFNNLNSGLGKGWVFGLMPRLVRSDSGIFFYYRGMHKFNYIKKKWVADKTYDLSDYNLTGDWRNGFKMLAKDGSFRVFNTEGFITSETDAAGNTTRYEYNDIGRLAKKTLADGPATEFRYDKDTGYLKEVVAPENKVTTFTHDDAGRIITITGPSPDAANLLPPTVTRFTYNTDNLITSVTMPNGETTKYEYDHAKRLSKIAHPNGCVETFISPITAGIIVTKNGEGTKENPAKLIPTDAIVGTKIVDGNKTTTKFGIWGYPLEVVDPLGNTIKYKRNAQGQVTEKTQIAVDENGKQVALNYRYEYDSRGNRVKEILPFGRGEQSWEYDSRTNAVKKIVDYNGVVTINEIDPRTGNIVKSSSFDDEKSAAAYTEEFYSYSPSPLPAVPSIPGGLLIAQIDPAGYATGNAYNLQGKLIEKYQYVEGGEIHSTTGTGEWRFDKLSPNKRYEIFITWKKDFGNPARSRFDFFQKDKTEPLYQHTINQKDEPHKHVYGSLGQNEIYQSIGRITAKNPSLKITAIKTDKGVGDVSTATIRLIEIQPLAIFRYNKDNQLIAQSDAAGRKIEFGYDLLNRQIKTVENETQITETFFDFANREAYSKNVFGIVSGKIFDAVDRVIEEFNFDPKVKPIDVAIKNSNTKNAVGSINNLEPNKRYEILASWKPDAKNSIAAKLTVKSDGSNILTKTIDQTIAPGKHPIAGNDFRSIGIIVTKNGTAEIMLESEVDVSLVSLKFIEIKSLARNRYDINNGNLIETIDRFGNITRYEYDKLARPTKTILSTLDPKRPESITETVYDDAGNVSKQISPYGYTTEYSHNPFSEVVQIIQTDDDRRGTIRQLVTKHQRDKSGEIIVTINPAGQKTAFKHDVRKRIIETINHLGQSEKTGYDNRGNIVTKIDVAGNKTIFQFNRQGQKTATILPKPNENAPSPTTRQFYNRRNQLSAIIAPDGVVNSLLYDQCGRGIANYIGVLREKPVWVKDGVATFEFAGLLPNDDLIPFISWKKSATPKTVNAKLIYNKDGKLVTTDLGEIDLSKEPKHDPACIQFSNDLYQRFGDSIKL
ncbi:MAG: hypothetical protein LBC74_01380, partial [Planctomycetaceae bacterium]|nr:hypothetical protein [Planctomycetaceae bacterium]